jgi:hypothetical protein
MTKQHDDPWAGFKLAGLAVVGMLITGWLCNWGHRPAPEPQQVTRDFTSYFVKAQDHVREQLKAPATASFPWFDYKVYETSDGYIVSSYVDAQNGFGANVRTQWYCKLTKSGDVVAVHF